MITTPAIAAAFRLATSLPVRVHRRADPPAPRFLRTPGNAVTQRRRARIREWWREGVGTYEIARRLEISPRAVQFHLKAIRAEDEASGA